MQCVASKTKGRITGEHTGLQENIQDYRRTGLFGLRHKGYQYPAHLNTAAGDLNLLPLNTSTHLK
jgi:hypothetical protein